MRGRGWGLVVVFWLGVLILGSQVFAAAELARQREASQRRAARALVAAELSRLGGEVAGGADSVRRAVRAGGSVLVLEVVRDEPAADGQPVRVRVLDARGGRLWEHGARLSWPAPRKRTTTGAMQP